MPPDIPLRILWVKAGKLLPVDTGGKIRSYNILRHLVRTYPVTVLTYYGGRRDLQYEVAIQSEFPDAETIHTATLDGTVFAQSIDYFRRVFDSAPFAVSKFTLAEIKRQVALSMTGKNFDVAVCDFLSASQNFPANPLIPVILFEHNVETALWQRLAANQTNAIKRAAYKLEARKMAAYERDALSRFNHVIVVSDHDRQQMLAMESSCAVSVVPTGVDTTAFTLAPPSIANPPRILFVGSMDWEPNIDAALYFCRDIFPRVRACFPSALFQIAGRNPHSSVKQLASDSVQVTGTVSSVTKYLHAATVVVVPLRIGGGTRLKIFEAMATGRAVVSTSIGAEGLPVENGRDLILADNTEAFGEAVIRLLSDAALRHHYELSGARLAAEYDWAKVAQQFAAVLQTCLNHASP